MILLWVFVLSAIALVRKDIFGKKPILNASISSSNAGSSTSGIVDGNAENTPAKMPLIASAALVNDPAIAGVNTGMNGLSESQYQSPRTKPTAIHVLSGIAVGDIVTLDSFETLIGRLDTSNITLHDSFVSSKHARIFWQNESCYIEDLHSTNGTVVDGSQISKVTELKVGSKITIGKNVLELI